MRTEKQEYLENETSEGIEKKKVPTHFRTLVVWSRFRDR